MYLILLEFREIVLVLLMLKACALIIMTVYGDRKIVLGSEFLHAEFEGVVKISLFVPVAHTRRIYVCTCQLIVPIIIVKTHYPLNGG